MKIHLKAMIKLNSVLFTFYLLVLNLTVVSSEIINSPAPTDDRWFTVKSQNNTTVEVNYSIGDFTLTDIEIDGELFQNINLPGDFLPNDAVRLIFRAQDDILLFHMKQRLA